MSSRLWRRVDHEDCVAFYAGRLPTRRMAQVRAYLEAHPDTARAARLDADHESRIASAYEDVLGERTPMRLRAGRGESSRRRMWLQPVVMAGALVIAAGGGWWLGVQQLPTRDRGAFSTQVARLASQATAGRPVPVGLETARGIPAPDLSARQYDLVGRRVFPETDGHVVMFVYRGTHGRRLRVYGKNVETSSSHMRVVAGGERWSMVQWRHGGNRYALVGDFSGAHLKSLAKAADYGAATAEDRAVAGIQPRVPDRRRPEQWQPQTPGARVLPVDNDGHLVGEM